MQTKDWLFLLATIFGPIIAVWVSVWLINRKERRKEKMDFFKELMVSRAIPASIGFVKSVNCIDVVFADSPKVQAAWRALHEEYKSDKSTSDTIKAKKTKLIEEIAKELGYTGITWDRIIEKAYTPEWLVNEIDGNEKFKEGQLEVINAMKDWYKTTLPSTQKPEEIASDNTKR